MSVIFYFKYQLNYMLHYITFQDPYKNFGLPSVGLLRNYLEPTHIPNVSHYVNLPFSSSFFSFFSQKFQFHHFVLDFFVVIIFLSDVN